MDPKHIHKKHNKTVLLYHLVCPVKYRQKAITEDVAKTIKDTCIEIGKCHEIFYIEIGTDTNHVHFLIQSVPVIPPKKIVQITKSITAREVFQKHPEVKKMLWGGKFWTSGYYMNTVGLYANESVIRNYVKQQGSTYQQVHRTQATLFE